MIQYYKYPTTQITINSTPNKQALRREASAVVADVEPLGATGTYIHTMRTQEGWSTGMQGSKLGKKLGARVHPDRKS